MGTRSTFTYGTAPARIAGPRDTLRRGQGGSPQGAVEYAGVKVRKPRSLGLIGFYDKNQYINLLGDPMLGNVECFNRVVWRLKRPVSMLHATFSFTSTVVSGVREISNTTMKCRRRPLECISFASWLIFALPSGTRIWHVTRPKDSGWTGWRRVKLLVLEVDRGPQPVRSFDHPRGQPGLNVIVHVPH